MERINILIVEDDPKVSSQIQQVLESNEFQVVGIATNYRDAIHDLMNKIVDMVILDIFLDDKPDGISIAKTIDAMPDKQKPFLFLTSVNDRGIFEEAKLTKPFAYMLKPFNELELIYAVEQAIERFYGRPNTLSMEDENAVIGDDYLFIKKGRSLKKVRVSEIIYVEVEEKYCNIVTNKEKFVILISLVKILDILSATKFCRTHRNFIVNTEKIVEIVPRDNLILLEGSHKATLSDTYKDIIKKIRTLR